MSIVGRSLFSGGPPPCAVVPFGKRRVEQGSLRYTPEHCNLKMAVSLCFGVEKATCFKWLQDGDLLRSHEANLRKSFDMFWLPPSKGR